MRLAQSMKMFKENSSRFNVRLILVKTRSHLQVCILVMVSKEPTAKFTWDKGSRYNENNSHKF
jgi:hypothetical protein